MPYRLLIVEPRGQRVERGVEADRRVYAGMGVFAADLHARRAAIWRIASGMGTAKVARMLRDIGQAKEIALDAPVTALELWPTDGMPDNPGAWPMTTVKIRARDRTRRRPWRRRRLNRDEPIWARVRRCARAIRAAWP